MRHSSFDFLCPVHRKQFEALRRDAALYGLHPFETYRSCEAQNDAFRRGVSMLKCGQSAHQHGQAVDFVPRKGTNGWHWPPAHDPIWRKLKQLAAKHGLVNRISWDRPHVECPCFQARKRAELDNEVQVRPA